MLSSMTSSWGGEVVPLSPHLVLVHGCVEVVLGAMEAQAQVAGGSLGAYLRAARSGAGRSRM